MLMEILDYAPHATMGICPATFLMKDVFHTIPNFIHLYLPYSCVRSKQADEKSCHKLTSRIDHWMTAPDGHGHMYKGGCIDIFVAIIILMY